eukprot:NODE_52_length_30984_cov_1.383358.p11 type:complete len:382 gc:universal NODE_52_length_30984_cov_1.383358:2979-1834(-)
MLIGTIIWGAIQPVLTIFIMVLLGVILKRKKIYNQTVMKELGKLAIQFLSPCLLLTKIAISINIGNIASYLSIILIAFIYQVYYIVMGLIIFFSTRRFLTSTFKKSVLSSCAFGNWSDFPIAILISVGASEPFGPGDSDKGIAYTTAFVLVLIPFLFTFGQFWIESDYKSINHEDSTIADPTITLSLTKRILNNRLFQLIVLNPNILGITIGLILGLAKPLNEIFVQPSGALYFIFKTFQVIGNGYVPISLSLFGANLMYADFSIFKKLLGFNVPQNLPKSVYIPICAVIFMRMILSPILGILFVKLISSHNLIDKSNKILQFVLILPTLMPMAQMNLILSQIQHPFGKPLEMATLTALCYTVTPFSLIASLTAAIYFIQS